MNEDRRTKAQILLELERVQVELHDLEKRIPEPPRVVPVASALAGCIRALDAIPPTKIPAGYQSEPRPDKAQISHVLRHLMSRYDIDLTERTTEPCSRVHIDDVSDEVLFDRIRGRF